MFGGGGRGRGGERRWGVGGDGEKGRRGEGEVWKEKEVKGERVKG